MECGFDDRWSSDGRGNVLCECQACPDCGLVDAYGFHEDGCPKLTEGAVVDDSDGRVVATGVGEGAAVMAAIRDCVEGKEVRSYRVGMRSSDVDD